MIISDVRPALQFNDKSNHAKQHLFVSCDCLVQVRSELWFEFLFLIKPQVTQKYLRHVQYSANMEEKLHSFLHELKKCKKLFDTH